MHIALTGYMGAGKGEIARILINKGFKYISLSEAVRKEATKLGLEHSRENLQQVGNNLRQTNGNGILGQMIREEIEKEEEKDWIIDGVRNPAEFKEISKLKNSYLLGVTAAREILIERILNRSRNSDANLSREEIATKLDKEEGKNEELSGQQVKKCMENVDFLIINEGTFSDLNKKIDHFIGLIKGKERPTFSEVFMEIAYTWAKRATCLRRKVGAVIAKDSQQLTAGYNGAPRGIPHCEEIGGCIRAKMNIPSGQRHEICRGTHAEQNAITQAAKFGIDINNGTLYCNTFPCIICAKMILNAGISKVIYDSDYDDPLSKEILKNQKSLEIIRYEGLRPRVQF